jgi:hypothetical protein
MSHSDKNIVCDKCHLSCCKQCIKLNLHGRQTCLYCLKKFYPNSFQWIKIKDNTCGEKY